MTQSIKRVLPLLDRLLIKRIAKPTATKSGVVMLPNEKMERIIEATVVAVGPGARMPKTGEHLPLQIAEGDRIIVANWGGDKVTMEDESELQIIQESQVLAKVN